MNCTNLSKKERKKEKNVVSIRFYICLFTCARLNLQLIIKEVYKLGNESTVVETEENQTKMMQPLCSYMTVKFVQSTD